jgi:hypothetical protein
MQTDFFARLATLELQSDLRLTIRKQPSGMMIVTVQMFGDKKEPKVLPSFTLTLLPKDLDDGFFEIMEHRPTQASNSFNPTEAMIKQWDKLVQQQTNTPASNKPESTNNTKKTPPVDKKYQAQMDKVEKLEKEGSYRQAYGQLPKEADFPQQKEAIQKKKNALMAIIDGGGLFGPANMEPDTAIPKAPSEGQTNTEEEEEEDQVEWEDRRDESRTDEEE